MAVIFLFSSQDATVSGGMSESLTRTILVYIRNLIGQAGQEMLDSFVNTRERFLRKGAHIFVFFWLGVFTANTIRQTTENKKRIFSISLIWCTVYAAFDELHQHFVPGRACMWQDWLLDTVGASLGIVLVLYSIRRKRKNKNLSAYK